MSVWSRVDTGCPCKGCEAPVRHIGCHDTCEKYVDWNKTRLADKDEQRKRMKIESDYHSYKTDRLQKLQKRYKRG